MRPRSIRLLIAASLLLLLVPALDCAWQRVFIPRLMGLEGRYFANDARRGEPSLTAVDIDVGTETLERRRRELGSQSFGVEWAGYVEIPAPGEYAFVTSSAGTLSLFVDGTRVVHGGEDGSGTVLLTEGLHEVLLEYSQSGGPAHLLLFWARDRQPVEPLSGESLLPPRPSWPALRAYRAGRAALLWLFAASGLVAVGAAVAAAARGARPFLRDRRHVVEAACLAALLATGAVVLDDFGVAWDETVQHEIGTLNYLYLSQGSTRLFNPGFAERHYGPAFELMLVLIEKQLQLHDSRAVFLVRHGATFLLFCVGVAFFYRLCVRHFRSWPTAIFASSCLVLSPRIFADSFYNSKDLPFLSVFVISIYTLVRFLDEGTARRAFWHALSSAVLVDIRIAGLLVPAMTLFLGTAELLFAKDPNRSPWRRAAVLSMYAAILAALTVAFFPFLWRSPLDHFVEVLAKMSRFPFGSPVRYLGRELPPEALPWHYLPVWIGVTTPLAYLGLFLAGLVAITGSCLRKPARLIGDPECRNNLLWIGWCLVPIALVAATGAIVYDGWRHLYFVYPGLLMIAVTGARRIAGALRKRLPSGLDASASGLAGVLWLLVVAEPLVFMVRYHPYGNVFFNRLAGHGMKTVRDRFEVDYWGLSYRRGLEYVLRHDARDTISVRLRPGRVDVSTAILPAAQRRRLRFAARGRDADYLLTNYRWHGAEYQSPREVYSVRIGDASIMTVYAVRDAPDLHPGP
jgi:hypothetical protein